MESLITLGTETSRSGTIYSGKPAIVAFLKRLGLPLGGMGTNPLNNFAHNRDAAGLAMVEFLMKQGVNPNHTGASGNIPLRGAIQSSNQKMVALLLRYRANPNLDIKGGQCKTVMPLDLAIDRGNAQIIQMLRRAGAKSQAQCQR